jgi:citrate lyase subunit beta/citryl-CoA lyase
MSFKSWLLAPGDDPASMEKALSSGANAIILDIERTVAPARKAQARAMVARFLVGIA